MANLYSGYIKAIYDGIVAKAAAGQALEDFEGKVFYGEDPTQVSDQFPFLWVHLKPEGGLVEEWEGAYIRKRGELRLIVTLGVANDSKTAPYGDATAAPPVKGIITQAEVVLNAVDSLGYTAVGGSARIDTSIPAAPRQVGEDRWVVDIEVMGTFHFVAGAR